jgi:hypothetical protein
VQDGHRQAAEADRGAVKGASAGADGGAVLPALRRPTRGLLEAGRRLAARFRYRTLEEAETAGWLTLGEDSVESCHHTRESGA